VADEPGREFAFAVNGDRTRWGYTFTPTDGGTIVTESWEILPAAEPSYVERFGDNAEEEITKRADGASSGMRRHQARSRIRLNHSGTALPAHTSRHAHRGACEERATEL
ncbi:MAG TPA: hypothetical protein PK781_06280, partial [Terrimesophilobacter sp.]|nr:hypothetical protein [Terrimesophilobacter sp.]